MHSALRLHAGRTGGTAHSPAVRAAVERVIAGVLEGSASSTDPAEAERIVQEHPGPCHRSETALKRLRDGMVQEHTVQTTNDEPGQ